MMPSTPMRLSLLTVIPAEAGMMPSTPMRLSLLTVIPAEAGMMPSTPMRLSLLTVIPAKAGIHGFSDQCSSQTRTPNTDARGRGGST